MYDFNEASQEWEDRWWHGLYWGVIFGVVGSVALASITLAVGTLEQPGSGMRRFKLYDVIAGSEATPADNVFLFEFNHEYERTETVLKDCLEIYE